MDVNITLIKNYGDEQIDMRIEAWMEFLQFTCVDTTECMGNGYRVVYNIDLSYKADAIVGEGNNLTNIKGKKIGIDGINRSIYFGYTCIFGRIQEILCDFFRYMRQYYTTSGKWILKECDINKDTEIYSLAQITHYIQIPLFERAMRSYVKLKRVEPISE